MPSSRRVHRRVSRPSCATPALFTGTSSEYLGRRALPRLLRDRRLVFLLGPEGAGKTRVALRLAEGDLLHLDTRALQNALVDQIVERCWDRRIVETPGLVLDGPVWLRNRPAARDALAELLRVRTAAGRRTMVCQSDADGSLDVLMALMEPGSFAVVGLRFPKGQRGRRRFARRICDQLGLPRVAARGTAQLEPWSYDRVIAFLEAWKPGDE